VQGGCLDEVRPVAELGVHGEFLILWHFCDFAPLLRLCHARSDDRSFHAIVIESGDAETSGARSSPYRRDEA
jgi:hypothetical protein